MLWGKRKSGVPDGKQDKVGTMGCKAGDRQGLGQVWLEVYA